MNKSALIIRNISQLSTDEIDGLLALAGLSQKDSMDRGENSYITQFKEFIQDEDKVAIRRLLTQPSVRDYLYDKIKSRIGYNVILHLDETPENKDEKTYILKKIHALSSNTNINLLYIGGGHGGYEGFSTVKRLSGLTMESVTQITTELQNKGIAFDGAILHSCSSAMFVKFFRPLLTEDGVLLSYSAELGSSSNWEMTLRWLLDRNYSNFFTGNALAKPWESGELETTTSVISTKYINQFTDLDNNNRGLPSFVDTSDESNFQRELVMSLFLAEKGIHSDKKTDIDTFNEVVAMEHFNEYFDLALKTSEAEMRKDTNSKSSFLL